MTIQSETDTLSEQHGLRKQHPWVVRTPPQGEPGEVYNALKRAGGMLTTAQLVEEVSKILTPHGIPVPSFRRARLAIERVVKTGWVTLSADGRSAMATPPISLTGVC